ncbi:3-hydroxyisobutyrate dehydrogenase [Variovorax sp. PBL-E5]|uniref:3-hydroxyisobutyrate dehydrogenase n=1 Tax=Variovorax sp. PBL-E5 TaxID=434014 RepID=UPI001319531A|nr:3-hydroxyisobutyrate dehydrogenase [Variovorax sp. PBL-E5]VTU45849.1 3-hydroxyisobutyrate dehydrogenase [Variovorax sp. PBL-E5]
MTTIGFIGLGNMGMPMASNLHRAGHEVRCFDTSAAALAEAAERGMSPCTSVAAAIEGAQCVVSMLPSGRHVLDVLVTPQELPYAPGCVVIDCSTIDIASCAAFHQALSRRGIATLDAPVSGGVTGAAAGALTFMVGGTEEAFARALPLLQRMGKNVIHAGDAGAGQAAKICNNMITGISMVAVAEALSLAKRLGLDLRKFFDIASTSSGQCWSLTSYSPEPGLVASSPSNRGYEGGFASELMLKDLRLAEQAAIASGAPALLGGAAASLYAMHCQAGKRRLDFSSIIQMMDDRPARAAV